VSDVGGPLGLARLVAALSLAVLFGALVLIVVAWPEGVEYILTVRFLRTVWAVAVFSSVAIAILLNRPDHRLDGGRVAQSHCVDRARPTRRPGSPRSLVWRSPVGAAG
jgi:hypothetical protein